MAEFLAAIIRWPDEGASAWQSVNTHQGGPGSAPIGSWHGMDRRQDIGVCQLALREIERNSKKSVDFRSRQEQSCFATARKRATRSLARGLSGEPALSRYKPHRSLLDRARRIVNPTTWQRLRPLSIPNNFMRRSDGSLAVMRAARSLMSEGPRTRSLSLLCKNACDLDRRSASLAHRSEVRNTRRAAPCVLGLGGFKAR